MESWIKAKRIEMKKTQQEIADCLDITRQYYNLIESRERQKNMDLNMASALANVFSMSLSDVCDCLESEKQNNQPT